MPLIEATENGLSMQPPAGSPKRAMRLSLAVGLLMFAGKTTAWHVTDSAAVFSDAAESVVHVVAVAFAAFSLWLSTRPPGPSFLYGYERIAFFSAGFEGATIAVAGLSIIATAADKWMGGGTVQNLGIGISVVLAAGCVNALLGFYLVRVGTRHRSIILEANGKHVLSDSWTSFGVAGALVLVNWTGWSFFDPAVAMLVAITILWSGGRLVWRSVAGLMDYSDPKLGRQLSRVLNQLCEEFGVEYHNLRFRSAGRRLFVELHLLFPQEVSLGEAHRRATDIEQRLAAASPVPAEITTHLEALEDHGQVHPEFPQNGGHAGA